MAEDIGVPLVSTPAVTARALLEAVRPREQWTDARDGTRVAREGALPSGDVSVPVAAGRSHRLTREHVEAGGAVCGENDLYRWNRPLTDAESAAAWAVELDVCAAHLSVTGTLRLPAGALVHTGTPEFHKNTSGLWWCDFTGLTLRAAHVPESLRASAGTLLPHPASPDGAEPTGPGWYATPTVAYMAEAYGFDPATITVAYVSGHSVALLKEWTDRIREAYKTRLAVLGITDGMAPAEFLAAFAARGERAAADPDAADAEALLSLYKGIYTSATGMWAQGCVPRPGESMDDAQARWESTTAPAWHYRPEIRFHVLAASRTAMHRRIVKTYALTGLAPLAANVDGLVYACDSGDPRDLAPLADGKPVPGALRLGTAPGSCKHDASVPMDVVAAALAAGEPLQGAHGIVPQYDTDGRRTATEEEV
jgi:hypothetical protein